MMALISCTVINVTLITTIHHFPYVLGIVEDVSNLEVEEKVFYFLFDLFLNPTLFPINSNKENKGTLFTLFTLSYK
jgi:hypothetical protein